MTKKKIATDKYDSLIPGYHDQFWKYAMVFCLKQVFMSYPRKHRESVYDLFIEGFKKAVYANEKPFIDHMEKMENDDILRTINASIFGDSEDILRHRDSILNNIEDKFRHLLVEQS